MDGKLVDPEALENTPFIRQVMADAGAAELPPSSPILPHALQPEVAADDRRNYHISTNDLGIGVPIERFYHNVHAIELLHKLEAENRLATPDEQDILSQYVGWGGLPQFFEESNAHYAELKVLLTEDEYTAARESTLTAFYTPPVVIRAMYGRINSRTNVSAFSADNAYYLLSSLEVRDSEGNFLRKADMFTKRTIRQRVTITSVDTASEALALSLAEKAKVDMPYMMELTRKSEDAILSDLRGVIFLNPAHDGNEDVAHKYLPADEYLSGNVREKLRTARLFAEKDERYTNPIPLGSYRGFQMTLYFDSFEKLFKISLQGALTYKVGLGTDVFGNIQRIDNLLESMPTRQIEYKEKLKNLEIQVENAKQEVAKPFPREDELKEKSARLDQLNILLNMDKRENEIVDGIQDEGEIQPQRESRDWER